MTRAWHGSPGHTCPACGYDGLEDPPYTATGGSSYEICPSCGFEFGHTDDNDGYTFATWRAEWVAGGCPWYSSARSAPVGWDPIAQLRRLDA